MAQFYNKPIIPIADKIKNTDNSIFLTGPKGVGKTTVLKYYKSMNNKNTINATFYNGYHIIFNDTQLINLYYMVLFIRKFLMFIRKNYENIYNQAFLFLDRFTLDLLTKLQDIYIHGFKRDYNIDERLLENPSILLDEILDIAVRYIDYKSLTVIIDNFDTFGESSIMYQKLIYNNLFKRFKVIATISDEVALHNEEKMNELQKDNVLIPVNYSNNVNFFRYLLDKEVYASYKVKTVSSFLRESTIKEIIKKTNGNIFTIKRIITRFINVFKNTNPYNYEKKILDITYSIVAYDKKEGINDNRGRKLHI